MTRGHFINHPFHIIEPAIVRDQLSEKQIQARLWFIKDYNLCANDYEMSL